MMVYGSMMMLLQPVTGYVPDGLTRAEYAKIKAAEEAAKGQRKPKKAVETLEDWQAEFETGKTGHRFAKVSTTAAELASRPGGRDKKRGGALTRWWWWLLLCLVMDADEVRRLVQEVSGPPRPIGSGGGRWLLGRGCRRLVSHRGLDRVDGF